jgi:hypothetical protein
MFWRPVQHAVPKEAVADTVEDAVEDILRDPTLTTQLNSCGYTTKVVFEGFERVRDNYPGVHAITLSVNAFMMGYGDHHMVVFVSEKPALREANPHDSIAPESVLGIAHSYVRYFHAHAVFGERAQEWWRGLGAVLKSCAGRSDLTCMMKWFAHLDTIVDSSTKTTEKNPDEAYILAAVRSKIQRGLEPPPIARLKYNIRTFLMDAFDYDSKLGIMVGGGKDATCTAVLAVIVIVVMSILG